MIAGRLEKLQLIVVTGKGGVGKSSVTAMLGRLLSGMRRKTLLIEVDPRENLHHLFDIPPSGGDVVEVDPFLKIQHLEPRSIIDDLVREKLKVGFLVKRVLASPVHQHFTAGAPGIKEAAVFGRALRWLEGHHPRGIETPECIILDAPATGHGVSWLLAAQLVSDVVKSGPIGEMAADVAAFLGDEARSGTVVVGMAEEMPVEETRELIEAMKTRMQRRPEFVVLNALYPPVPDEGTDSEADDFLHDLWIRRRQINESERARLAAVWEGPLLELPLLPMDPGPALVGRLGVELSRWLSRQASGRGGRG